MGLSTLNFFFNIFMTVINKIMAFIWVSAPCSGEPSHCFGGTRCLCLQSE